MTPGGWIFLSLSLAFVWGLAAFCFHRVLTAPDSVPADGEQTPDVDS